MVTLLRFLGLHICGCSTAKSHARIFIKYSGYVLTQEDQALIKLPWQDFEYLWVLTFMGVPQAKPMHGFSPNFQNMLTETGSSTE